MLIYVFNVLLVKKYVKKIIQLKHIPMKIILTTKICIHEKYVLSLFIMARRSYTGWHDNEFLFAVDQRTYCFFYFCINNMPSLNKTLSKHMI